MGSDLFRAGMRRLAGGVTIITSVDAEGRRCGITATAVCSLAAEPPSLIACVNRSTSIAAVVEQRGVFAVNVLAEDQQPVAETFAGRTGHSREDRFAIGDWGIAETGAPVLGGAAVSFDCRLAEIHEFATHMILIGEVVATRVEGEEASPLIYGGGAFLTARQAPAAAPAA
ncbi:flavin reductase family protein [Rhizobium alvei]|uniref:Flavin reductase family protein n=1 Tax=Rhizobium alvei TaxID=1132659 RepID=A0ABT8YMT4_9HYPH|nr:flavin reductase family protein [Rhizobium alvei]MDO6965045.1 flavin reductase family protein [Rhizobium alvei]